MSSRHRARHLTSCPSEAVTSRGIVRVTVRPHGDWTSRRRPVEHLIRAVNDAENAGWLRRAEVIDVLGRNPRHQGARQLRYVVGLDPTGSAFEDDFPALQRRTASPSRP